uniref:Uncharacterized protein n=1 Tax=Rhizophagus irregularis (strain DAOM 181602 / DAOM 197198 / MUCL 43194) TaxID=747089 RepID=U9U4P4_RHIID
MESLGNFNNYRSGLKASSSLPVATIIAFPLSLIHYFFQVPYFQSEVRGTNGLSQECEKIPSYNLISFSCRCRIYSINQLQ